MMRTLSAALVLVLALLAVSVGPLHAQSDPDLPPTIIHFESSVESVTLAEAEAGTVATTLSWEIIGVEPRHRVIVQRYAITSWESALPDDAAPLSAAGDVVLPVTHPYNFGPPVYRLAVLDADGRMLDQRMRVIEYAPEMEEPPVIDSFASDAGTLNAFALANRTARLPVSWSVANRQPDTNLVFEQVLVGGRAVSVELPRLNVWVPSEGQGVVAPVLPGAGQPVRLRLRVVEMVDGDTVAEFDLPPLTVTGSADQPAPQVPAEPQPVPGGDDAGGEMTGGAAPPASPSAVQVMSFESAPEILPRGGTVTLNWDVRNAVNVNVALLGPDGQVVQTAPEAAAGTWTLTLPESYVDNVTFRLYAVGADRTRVQETLTLDVICPFTYFFGPTSLSLTCPAGPPQTVQASFQRFERGYMIWRGDTSDIYVLYDSGLVNRFKDSWLGEPLYFSEPAPEGVYRPDRAFGKVWIENPQVRAGLGWAVNFERGYTMRYQRSADSQSPRLYLDLPDGSVVYIVENTWRFLR